MVEKCLQLVRGVEAIPPASYRWCQLDALCFHQVFGGISKRETRRLTRYRLEKLVQNWRLSTMRRTILRGVGGMMPEELPEQTRVERWRSSNLSRYQEFLVDASTGAKRFSAQPWQPTKYPNCTQFVTEPTTSSSIGAKHCSRYVTYP